MARGRSGADGAPKKSIRYAIMGFLKHFRSRSKLENDEQQAYFHGQNGHANSSNGGYAQRAPAVRGRNYTARLPPKVLKRIFESVCPHTTDFSFEVSEKADIGDGCMLCDLRDLANCAKVCPAWYQPAQETLYGSVRIDPVHYCELEDVFAGKRGRKSRHGNAEDVPAVRLRLLANTLKDGHWLGSQVKFLKLPYMTRETCKADLARAISACPNLQYCDLPEGFYNGDQSCATLRQEMQTHCPDIRRMKYHEGSEQLFQLLSQRYWQHIEVLELSKLKVEPSTLRMVVASLPTLHELKITDVPCSTDEIFKVAPQVPNFPPLQSLMLEKCHRVTAAGLNLYLQRPETREVLTNLSLTNTGVQVTELSSVLWSATHLQNLAFVATVSQSLPLEPLQPLTSITLQTLHFEITPTDDHLASGLPKPSDSYYNYLLSSILSNSLPALKALYVRDSRLPDALLLAPPQPSFAGGGSPRGLSQPLVVYTKGLDESEWVFNSLTPSDIPGRPGSSHGGRPLSAYSASRGLGPQWGGEARKSVVVGNGFGGFLAVPTEEAAPRPASSGNRRAGPGSPNSPTASSSGKGGWFSQRSSSAHEKRVSRADLWR